MNVNANGTDDRHDGRDDDPVMDWALGERFGGEQPPDLLAAVREQLATQPSRPVRPRPAWSQLWVAAIALLGAFVVIAVATWPRDAGTQEAQGPRGSQGTTEPVLATVTSLGDVAALPGTTRGVEAIGVDDEVIAALTRLRELEVLVVREPWNESFGLGLKMTPPATPRHVTVAAWNAVFQLKKLRRLEFSGTPLVARIEPAKVAAFAAGLEALPLLESLTLRCLDTSDELLASLPKARGLRRLDLSFNHGFVEDGIVALLGCAPLRSLSLRGCQQLRDNELARLAELPELEHLDVSLIDGVNWHAGTGEVDDEVARQTRLRAERHGDRLGMGPGANMFAALALRGRLRSLDVSGGHWRTQDLGLLRGAFLDDDADGAILKAMGGHQADAGFVVQLPKSLQRLEVCGDYTDDFCRAVAEHLTKLRHLNISACDWITDRGLATVAAMPSLRGLDMRQMRGLTVGSIDALLAARQLEELDVRHCDFVTAEHVVRLRQALPRLRALRTNVPEAEVEAWQRAQGAAHVRNKEEIARLPATVRSVRGIGLDDEAMAALARLESLESLELQRNRSFTTVLGPGPVAIRLSPLSEGGLGKLASLRSLRHLSLVGLDGLGPEALAGLVRIASLVELELASMPLPRRWLQDLATLPLRSLRLEDCSVPPTGLQMLANMQTLRSLEIHGGSGMRAEDLALLARLPSLEGLVIARIQAEGARQPDGTFALSRPDSGWLVTDDVVTAFAGHRRLRTLSLRHTGVTAKGLAALRQLPALEQLDLAETFLAADDLAQLPPRLVRLTLSACPLLVGDFGSALARGATDLVALDLHDSPQLGPVGLESLRALRGLRTLDVSGCAGITADAVAKLQGLEVLVARNLEHFGTDDWATIRAMPNLKTLETEKIRETLR